MTISRRGMFGVMAALPVAMPALLKTAATLPVAVNVTPIWTGTGWTEGLSPSATNEYARKMMATWRRSWRGKYIDARAT